VFSCSFFSLIKLQVYYIDVKEDENLRLDAFFLSSFLSIEFMAPIHLFKKPQQSIKKTGGKIWS